MKLIFDLPDGAEISAPLPDTILLRRSGDGDTLELRFSERLSLPGDACAAQLVLGGKALFSGDVYEQETRLAGGAWAERIVLKSREAALSKCDAMPRTLRMPSLRLMEKLYLTPFGLRAEGDFAPKPGELVIESGTSCMEVLEAFALNFLKATPYFTRDGVLRFGSRAPKPIQLKNVLEAEVLRRPGERIGRVIVQNARTGAYDALYESAAGASKREVYLPADAKTAPETVLAQGERAYLRVRIVCGGFIDAEVGDTVELETLGMLRLRSLLYRFSADAERTELEFEPEVKEGEHERN